MIRSIFGRLPPCCAPRAVLGPAVFSRPIRAGAYEAAFDPEALAEARKWHAGFTEDSLPKGQHTFSRSSGPGGQHVNKTESKATSSWSVAEVAKGLPKLMRIAVRSSRYYKKGADAIVIQAQTERSRGANLDANRVKFAEELRRLYSETVPGETSEKKQKKFEALEKTFHNQRVKAKKQNSFKKASRRGQE